MSTRYVDFAIGYKHGTHLSTDQDWTCCSKGVYYVCTLGPATGCCSSGDQVPFKNLLLVIAGHLECERGEMWGEGKKKKVPEQPKEGSGEWSRLCASHFAPFTGK